MNPIQRVLTRLRRDDGVTLAELAVTTSIMSAVMAVFTTGVVQLFQAGNNSQQVATTESQLNTAFLRLDRNLRYAAGIGPVHPIEGPNQFVEYVNTDTANGEPECAQLELNAAKKVLRRQVWPQTTKPTGKWAVLASDIDASSSFKLLKPLSDTGFQRLEITLVVGGIPGRGSAKSETVFTFTALNSTRATETAKVCPEARA